MAFCISFVSNDDVFDNWCEIFDLVFMLCLLLFNK